MPFHGMPQQPSTSAARDQAKLFAFIEAFEKATQAEFSATEANLSVTLASAALDSELESNAKDALLNAMYCAPHEVFIA